MSLVGMLLLVVAVISFVAGAIILTPLGIILLAFAIYSWKALYPTLLRISQWSTEKRNFWPLIVLWVGLSIVFLMVGLTVPWFFRVSSLSILFFIWLFVLWFLLFVLVSIPILLAIAVWLIKGVQWLWPRYRERWWKTFKPSAIFSRPPNTPETQAKHKRKHTKGLKSDKKPKVSAAIVHKEPGAGYTPTSGYTSNKQEYDSGLKSYKEQKKGSVTFYEKPKSNGNSLLEYPGKLVSKALSMLHLG